MDYARYDRIRAVQWRHDHLRLLDQRRLPFEEVWIDCTDAASVAQAI
ncbi:MAG TPA: S-methyl-5-thioribose-1-phosphate isomerase, partial [Mizugakiibacter sp.]